MDEITKTDRLKYMQYRYEQSSVPFSEREAFLRTPSHMSSFLELSTKLELKNDTAEIISDLEEKEFLPEISHFSGCIPELPQLESVPKAEIIPHVPKDLFQSSLVLSVPQLQQIGIIPMDEEKEPVSFHFFEKIIICVDKLLLKFK